MNYKLFRIFVAKMTSLASIKLQKLCIGYRAKGNEKTVAQNISAAIFPGELTCLLGQNGIGKSTLLRTLSAFQNALDGEVLLTDKDGKERRLTELTDKELSRLIGVVLTEKPDVRNMTARELVDLGRSPYTGFWGGLTADDKEVVSAALKQVGIESLAERPVHTLSDGERQKVMIAKALAQETPVIFLDEPTAFLDFPSKVDMMQLLGRLAHEQQKTIFLSTHDVELALQTADRIWVMEAGGISIGTPQQLAEDGTLSRFIERKGISFDKQTMTIHVNHN